MKWKTTLAASIILSASPAWGAVILVDYSDRAANPSLGAVWNTVDLGDPGSALVDSMGAPSGVTIHFAGDPWRESASDQGNWPAGDVGWVDGSVTADNIFNQTGNTSTVTFSGLPPDAIYRIEHLAARAIGFRIADYLVNGSYADSTPNGDDFDARLDGWVGGNILTWNAVAVRPSGEIVLTVTDVQDFGYLNASRLERISEPATTMMLILGLGSLPIL